MAHGRWERKGVGGGGRGGADGEAPESKRLRRNDELPMESISLLTQGSQVGFGAGKGEVERESNRDAQLKPEWEETKRAETKASRKK